MLSEPTVLCSLPSITNNYNDPHRDSVSVTKRKCSQSYDPSGNFEYRDENEGFSQAITKRARIVDASDALSSSTKADVFHAHATPNRVNEHDGCGDDPSLFSSKDVANFLTLLLNGLNKNSRKSESSSSPEPMLKSPSPYQQRPTSPLAQSPYRQPFVRKQVGGHFDRRVEPRLKRQVLYRNLIQDVRSFPPNCRSADWIEALHEMGWETLHPSYAFDIRDISVPSDDDSDDDLLEEVDIEQYANH